MSRSILVIAVHPDDETLGCGGTILRHIVHGENVYCLFVTSGNPEQKSMIPQLQARYGFTQTICLDLPELLLQDISLNEMIPAIGEVFHKLQPEVLYIPNRSDIHSDHRTVFDAVAACTKPFRFPYIRKILMCEVISETDVSPALTEMAFIPNVFVDVTPFFEKKIEIMKIFKSEILPYPQTRNIEAMTALNRYRGSQIGVEYAESFMLLKEILG